MAIHKSAQGKQIDMAALASQNERVRAVGNMNVNARGDILDSNNRVIQDATKRVKSTYTKTVGTNPNPPAPAAPVSVPRAALSKEEQMFEDDDEDIIK